MIKLAPSESGSFHNFKCGEVYCLSTTRYDISCCLCGSKVELHLFPKHFQQQHLSTATKEKECPLSPIGTRAKRKNDAENDPLLPTDELLNIKPEDIDEEEMSAFSWNDNFETDEIPIDVPVVNKAEGKYEPDAPTDIGEMGAKTDTFCAENDDDVYIGIESDEWLHEKYSYADVPSEEDDPVDLEGITITDIKVDLYDSDEDSGDGDKEDDFFSIPQKKKTFNEIPADYLIEAVRCEICNRLFNSRIGLKVHMTVVHDRKNAPAAKAKSSSSKTLTSQEFPCDQCEQKFLTERALTTHKYKHTGISCDICGKPFSQIGNMERHRIRHTGIKTIHCTECDMSFFTERERKAHMIRHTGIMPHICEICGKRCRDHGVLTAHMRRHTGERPAKCNVCGKSFFCGYDLNVHSVTHTTERPFKCDICGSTFQLKKSLRVHKKIHSKDRNHTCKVCGKSFTQSSGLHSHMRMHDAAPINDGTNKAFETGDSADDVADIAVQVSNAAIVNVAVAHDGTQWGLGIM